MRKCALCPICNAKVYPKIAPHKELTNNPHTHRPTSL